MMKQINWLLILLLTVTVYNYPNPFNPQSGQTTSIECTTDTTTEAFLYIYDMSARFVAFKPFDLQGGAKNQISWDGYSDYNQLVGNGIYLYQIINKARQRVGRGKIWVINQ
ncbi:MAG: T9SS type A sorting domain-containing protein [Candidatus Margulisbacteria bacterium]|nr:T9SS type A sorting domain-containing protein [Candidatus Margulisiibacteriota bacterium]